MPRFLNQDILKLPIKVQDRMPLQVRKEITHSNEMNDEMNNKISDLDMSVWNARNITKPIFSIYSMQSAVQ
jgi:hypothetical protein